MRLPPPDPLSTILLYVSAVVMALKEALAPGSAIAAQVPALTMSGVWSYIPAVLLALAFVIWVARGARGTTPTPPSLNSPQAAPPTHPAPPPRPLLPAHEPLSSEQMHHLLVFGMFVFAMVGVGAVSRCGGEPTRDPIPAEAALAAAKK